MYVFGGCDGSSWLNDFYALNLKTLTWRKIEPTGQCPSNRFGFACGTYQSKMMIFGGFDGTH
jgi:N-acetylneuraminic acid mutarotase